MRHLRAIRGSEGMKLRCLGIMIAMAIVLVRTLPEVSLLISLMVFGPCSALSFGSLDP